MTQQAPIVKVYEEEIEKKVKVLDRFRLESEEVAQEF